MYSDSHEFALILSRIYDSNYSDHDWPPSVKPMAFHEAAREFKNKWEVLHEVYRSSAAMVCLEDGLEPMKHTITEVGPSVEAERRERNTRLVDYDSYRRRLKATEAKRDAIEVSA